MHSDKKIDVKEVIGDIFKKYPDLTVQEFIDGIADFLAFTATLQKEITSYFMESYLKWHTYHYIKSMSNKEK